MADCVICSCEDRLLYPIRNPVTGISRHICEECVIEAVSIAKKYRLSVVGEYDSEDDEEDGTIKSNKSG